MPQIDWVTDPRDSSRGLVLIDVPVAEPSQRPLLVKRYVTEGEKRIDTVIGYFERRRTNVDCR